MAPADRRAQLIEVAERLFIERGYVAVSIEDIASAAGVTRPVIYDHFGSREGAYVACVARARQSYEARLAERFDPTLAPEEQLRAGGKAYFSMVEEDPGRWALLFASAAVLPREHAERVASLRLATIEQTRVLLAAAAPNAPAQKIEAGAHVISGAAERLGHWWLTRPDLTRDEIVEHFVALLWGGLAPYVD